MSYLKNRPGRECNFMGCSNKNSSKKRVASAADFTCEIKNNF